MSTLIDILFLCKCSFFPRAVCAERSTGMWIVRAQRTRLNERTNNNKKYFINNLYINYIFSHFICQQKLHVLNFAEKLKCISWKVYVCRCIALSWKKFHNSCDILFALLLGIFPLTLIENLHYVIANTLLQSCELCSFSLQLRVFLC